MISIKTKPTIIAPATIDKIKMYKLLILGGGLF